MHVAPIDSGAHAGAQRLLQLIHLPDQGIEIRVRCE